MSNSLFLRPNSTGGPRSCLRCLFRSPKLIWRSRPRIAFTASYHIPSFENVDVLLLGPSYPNHFCGMLDQRLFNIVWTNVLQVLSCYPPPASKQCQLGTVIPRSFMSQKTAPASPPTFFHDVASQIRLLHASWTSPSRCFVSTACTQKHAAAHANPCSIARTVER